jgi:hypothetical protein
MSSLILEAPFPGASVFFHNPMFLIFAGDNPFLSDAGKYLIPEGNKKVR